MRILLTVSVFAFVYTIIGYSTVSGQCTATTPAAFYSCYGGQGAFTKHSRDALATFIEVEDAIGQEDYTKAKSLLEDLFAQYPKGSNLWFNAYQSVNGCNIGSPHAYYGLRMEEDIVDYYLQSPPSSVPKAKINMKVVLVGCSQGIQPTTIQELESGTGSFVTNVLDQSLLVNEYYLVKQSYDLFVKYVHAITYGMLVVEVDFVELSDLCIDMEVTSSSPYIARGGLDQVWQSIDTEQRDTTDFWLIVQPSHVPSNLVFKDIAFISGGMGSDDKGGPVFITDDKWMVRKPFHLGEGDYTEIERRAYLPQWFQHEFYHHLFRIFPEYELEVNGHDWFNLSFWPSDFEGQYETDFYAEALHKRIQDECHELPKRLITRQRDNNSQTLSQLSMDELLGNYSLDIVQNEWHEGQLIKSGSKYYWRNKANVQWEVLPTIQDGKLKTGLDNPYYGADFILELYLDGIGEVLPDVVGLRFLGETYKKRFDLLRGELPFELAIGSYTKVPYDNSKDQGDITKSGGNLSWKSKATDNWSLIPNVLDEAFILGQDSPNPGDRLALILLEDTCDTYVLGFEYQGYYYWKDKRNTSNTSPILVNPIMDANLPEGFNNTSISLTNAFQDLEGDRLYYYVTSTNPSLIQATIDGTNINIQGGQQGQTTLHVTAIDANGGYATDEINVQVGITTTDELNPNNQYLVYPNPVHRFLSIDTEVLQYNVEILTMTGVVLQKSSFNSGNTTLDLLKLAPGGYILNIIDSKGHVYTERIVKE